MKKIFSILLAGATFMSVVSCSDSDYDDKYADPSKTSTVGVPQVFTGIMNAGNSWMNMKYYRYYTQSTTEGFFSGVIGDVNSRGRYRGASEGYYNSRWVDFYNMVTQYRLLEHTYNNLPEDEKATNEIFYHLSQVVVYAQLHEVLSLWGDVPFIGAGTLGLTSDYEGAKAACVYDDDVVLYKKMLADLKAVGDYLAGSVNGNGLTSLARQDITVAAGDQMMWRKYTNSLRLRIALHLATSGDCTTEAREAIAEILNNPGQYPLIDSNSENMGITPDTQTDTFNFGKDMASALRTGGMAAGSATMLRVMNVPANGIPDANTDPRIQVMYDPNPDGEYIAADIRLSNTEISNIEDEKRQEYIQKGITICNYYVEIDTLAISGYQSYMGNENLFSLWISAAEVSLSKAEAYLMGYGVAADQNAARENFITGVKQSVEYYWNMKETSTLYEKVGAGNDSYYGYRPLVKPTDAEIQAYAENIWKPTQQAVCEQLWLNFSFLNELEAWNVTRRTGYPLVSFATDNQVSNYPTPPHRLPYVSDELTYNSQNAQEAISKNYEETTGYYTPLFWAKREYYKMIN